MAAAARLPGIYFETAPRVLDEALPRMDVAAFVGFAERGPLDTPVPVEDPVRFRELFGDDLRLARDAERGEDDGSYLGPAVEAFFRDGGQRCWVVRVTGRGGDAPEGVELPVPGLVRAAELVPAAPLPAPVRARARSRGSWARALAVGSVLRPRAVTLAAEPEAAFAAGGGYGLDLAAGAGEIVPGDLLEAVGGNLSLLLFAETVTPVAGGLRVRARSGWWLERPPGAGPDDALDAVPLDEESARERLAASPPDLPPATVRRLSFELQVWRGLRLEARLAELAFHPGHPRFWGALPIDEELFALSHGRIAPIPEPARAALLAQAATPRFPLAGSAGLAAACLPFRMGDRPDPSSLGRVEPEPDDRLAADGLAGFGAHLFVDPSLAAVRLGALPGEAEHALSFDAPTAGGAAPRLVGVHSLWPVDEVTLVAAPDAVHRPWAPAAPPAPEPEPETEAEEPEAADFHPCPGPFPDQAREEEPPEPESSAVPAGARPPAYELDPAEGSEAPELLAVHRALLRLAAARSDLLAVLSLPRHYRVEEVRSHLAALDPGTSGGGDAGGAASRVSVPALTLGEAATLGFGALYHPWLAAVGGAGARRGAVFTPPDGAVCGIAARRAREDGAWVAPANRTLAGVVALDPRFRDDEEATLAPTRLNLVQQKARGFLVLDNDTLSAAADRRPIQVRRLLILLRRLALREGTTYVFEPNDAGFRRAVESRFHRLLSDLYVRGAFAGDRPEAGFRVVADDTVNTPESVDLGRLIVELRVAPSRPLAFLTVRLLLAGPERLAVLEV